jgi:hypothetical protein
VSKVVCFIQEAPMLLLRELSSCFLNEYYSLASGVEGVVC